MALSTEAEPLHEFDRDDLPAAFARKEAEVGVVLQCAAYVAAALVAAVDPQAASAPPASAPAVAPAKPATQPVAAPQGSKR